MTTRGISNNNPGNIEVGAPWQGLASPDSDGRFCVFKSPTWGIRAIARVVVAYQDRHDIMNISGIISRWAPPSDNNDTDSYINHAAVKVGVGRDDVINVHDYRVMRPLVEAIILHENGTQPYSDSQIDKGLTLAGIESTDKPLLQSRTVKGAQAASIGVAGTALSEAGNQLAPLADYSETIKYVFLALTIIGIAVTVWARIDDKNKGLR